MFAPGGPKPWKTKKGHSRLDAMVDEAREKGFKMTDIKDVDEADRKLSIHASVKEEEATTAPTGDNKV